MIPKVKLYRGRLPISEPGEIDVTIKSSVAPWRSFAPTWGLVTDHKSRKISDDEYCDSYYKLLSSRSQQHGYNLPIDELKTLATQVGGFVVFCCYCRPSRLCHTDLLIDWLTGAYPDEFGKGR